jgi:hypothetical protein
MQHADIDASLCTGEPLERLDDGFSPPARPTEQRPEDQALPPEPALTEKSQF